MRFAGPYLLLLMGASALQAQARLPWDAAALSKPPRTFETTTDEPGVKALFYESVLFHGKPTRVFAYYGLPAGAGRAQRAPAMVLIHGGGGTAFAEWVRMWNKRGYAAIAMDTCGNRPGRAESKWANPPRQRHEFSGPPGWGDFAHVDEAPGDQWSYHAVAAAVLAHSLIRSFPEVDPKRIGVTGISWGGYLTSIVAGVDKRFRFAAPVYGCGFLGEDSAWLAEFEKMGKERAARWLSLWDPSEYLGRARAPMLWVTGTNDFAYPFPSLQRSYRLPRGRRTLAIRVRMPHDHVAGAKPEEIFAYADALLGHGVPLARVVSSQTAGGRILVRYRSRQAMARAELNFTRNTGRWQDRRWETVAAALDGRRHTASAEVPADARAWYVNLFDDRGLVVSSEHETR
jgi:cephalosporin-C deacetylase-like acetyl esterase